MFLTLFSFVNSASLQAWVYPGDPGCGINGTDDTLTIFAKNKINVLKPYFRFPLSREEARFRAC